MGRPKDRLTLEERLLKARRINPVTSCWEWTRAINTAGYGHMVFEGRHVLAHRCAAIVWLGYDPESPLFVLHHCDNRICFNPAHLYIGTRADNMRDRGERMRSRGGNQKLDEGRVRAIRLALNEGRTLCCVAEEFGVSASTICSIRLGRSYRWVV